MDKNLAKLSKTISEAASGSKQASAAFGKMGIDVKNADGSVKNSEQVLMEMADAFQKLPAGAQRATLAMDVFGKSGASMVSMLKGGSAELKSMVDEGKTSAGNIEDVAAAMEKLKDAGTRTKSALVGFFASVVSTDAFKTFIDGIESSAKALREFMGERKQAAEISERNAEYEKQGAEADLRRLYIEKSIALQKNENVAAIAQEIAAAQKKAQLDSDALWLLEERGKVIALQRKEDRSAEDDEKLERMKAGIKLIDDKAAAEAKAAAEKKKAAEEAAAAAAKAVANYGSENKAHEEALKKYEAETKKLEEWLDSYRKAKKTESELAEDAYKKEMENLDALLERKKISATEHSVHSINAEADYQAKLKEIGKKYEDEKAKTAEEAQSRAWELRKIAASDSQSLMQIELEQIEARYAKEIKLAEQAKTDTSLLENAKAAEIAAVKEREIEQESQRMEQLRSLRETAAQSENERQELQIERINAKYDLELERAQGNAELITELERARHAELMRMEEARRDMQLQSAAAGLNAIATLTEGHKEFAALYKASAIGEAVINATQSVLKTMSSVPFPLNIPMAAAQAAVAAVQVQKIAATKMYRGGMIPGVNTLVMANEEGREAILNTGAVRRVGGEAGVNALNNGIYNSNSYDNRKSTSIVNIHSTIISTKTLNDEILPALRWQERRR